MVGIAQSTLAAYELEVRYPSPENRDRILHFLQRNQVPLKPESLRIPQANWVIQARFDGGEWESWTGMFDGQIPKKDMISWFRKHWGPDTENYQRLARQHRSVEFGLFRTGRNGKRREFVQSLTATERSAP